MLRLASASSRLPGSERAADETAERLAAELAGCPARAVIFFATTAHGPGYGRVERAVAAATGAPHVVGCSASGVVATEGEVESGPGIAALAIAGDVDVRRFFVPSLRGRAEEIGRELGRVAQTLDAEPQTLLVLADSYNLAPDELLAGVAAVAPGVAVIGAGATEDGTTGETSVVARGVAASNALSGLALGGVRVRAAVSSPCSLYGPWWTVTGAEGNRILTLDGAPALTAFLQRLPASLREDPAPALRATLLALAAPVGGDEIAPPYVLRPIVGMDGRCDALLAGDEVFAGMRVAIAVRDPHAAREALDANLARLAGESAGLAGALYFNAMGRGEAFYGIPELESAYLRRRLGDLPLAGLYCGAGFAPLGGRNRFHQYAGLVIGIEPA